MIPIDFKIGMVGPSKAGKTSLMTAIYKDVSSRLQGNSHGIDYFPEDSATKIAIDRAVAEFAACCAASDDVFAVPKLAGTETVSNYKFAFTIPVQEGLQQLKINIMDYPGGMLDTTMFAEKVQPHLIGSSALLVPIPADILMEWKKNVGKNTNRAKTITMAAHYMLEVENVVKVVKNWANRRAQQNESSLLIFVPIRCEAYFNDNGGTEDKSEELHAAVQKLYLDELELDANEKKLIQIETHAVDTYGVVELRDVAIETSNGGPYLVSIFRKRLRGKNKLMIKGAFEILSTIINFSLNKNAKKLGIDRQKLEDAIRERGLWDKLWAWIMGDSEKQALLETIRQYHGAFQAMSIVSELFKTLPARQRCLNKLEN